MSDTVSRAPFYCRHPTEAGASCKTAQTRQARTVTIREKLRELCEDCPACGGDEADDAPEAALEAWDEGRSTEPWSGGWSGHLTEELRAALTL